MARLLNFYQLWLDDLFPRAKFADGLAIIERLGHSKRLQTMRRTWIDEEKPSNGPKETLQMGSHEENIVNKETSMAEDHETMSNIPRLHNRDGDDLFMPDDIRHERPVGDSTTSPDDDLDEFDALLREHGDGPGMQSKTSTGTRNDHTPSDYDLDVFDALPREHENEARHEINTSTKAPGGEGTLPENNDLDELDYLLREHGNNPDMAKESPKEYGD